MKNAAKGKVRNGAKLFLLTLILTVMSFVTASAEDKMTGTRNFYYQRNGSEVVISNSGMISSQAGGTIFIACYDGEVLDCVKMIKADANIDPFYVREFTMKLSDNVENLKVRAFAWDSASAMTPLCDAKDISETPGDVIRAEGRVLSTYKMDYTLSVNQVLVELQGEQYAYVTLADISKVKDMSEHIFELLEIDYILSEDDTMVVLGYSQSNKDKIVTFNNELYASNNIASLIYSNSARISFYNSEISSSTTDYKLADDVKLIVNGVIVDENAYIQWSGANTNMANDINKVLGVNPYESVKLVDTPKHGASSTDGYYDYIVVNYYATAVVEEAYTKANGNKVIATNSGVFATIEIDETDDAEVYTFVDTNGNELTFDDLEKNDVLSIAYDIRLDNHNATTQLAARNSDFFNIIVSKNSVKGQVVGTYVKYNNTYYQMESGDYTAAYGMAPSLKLGQEYTFYLDKDGNIAKSELVASSINYAIIDKFFISAGDQKVRLILKDGSKADYVLKPDGNYSMYGFGAEYYINDGKIPLTTNTPLYTDENCNGTIEDYEIDLNRIVRYTVNKSDEVTLDAIPYSATGAVGHDKIYNAATNRIGSYALAETSVILDASAYASQGSGSVSKVSVSRLIDDMNYAAIFAGDRINNAYPFVVLLSGRVTEGGTEDDTDDNPDDTTVTPSEGYAIIDRFFLSAGDEKVRLILKDGSKADYVLKPGGNGSVYGFGEFGFDGKISLTTNTPLYTDENWNGMIEGYEIEIDRIVSYTVNSSDEVTLTPITTAVAVGDANNMFDAATNRIGSYALSDDSVILNASAYAPQGKGSVSTTTISNLFDEMNYMAIFAGEKQNGAYPFVVLLSYNSGFNVNTGMVVVAGSPSLVVVDGEEKFSIPVWKGNPATAEKVDLITADTTVPYNYDANCDGTVDAYPTLLKEGDAFIYSTNAEDEVDHIAVVFSDVPSLSYAGISYDFAQMGRKMPMYYDNGVMNAVTYVGQGMNLAPTYILAPVIRRYESSIDLANIADSGWNPATPSFITYDDGVNYSYAPDVEIYEYDMSYKAGNRVSVTSSNGVIQSIIPESTKLNNGTMIDWTHSAVTPAFALIRVYDDDVQEVYSISVAY